MRTLRDTNHCPSVSCWIVLPGWPCNSYGSYTSLALRGKCEGQWAGGVFAVLSHGSSSLLL